MKRLLPLVLVSLISAAFAQSGQLRIGEIEFFGYDGFDLGKVRAVLPVHEGDAITESDEAVRGAINRIKEAVRHATGREPTDVQTVCCDERNQWMLFIGLKGKSVKNISYNPLPKSAIYLSPEALALYDEMIAVLMRAVQSGAAEEDDSRGYALSANPALRSEQLAARNYALSHERLILRVLESSSEARQRIAAAYFMGYARQSSQQIAALVRASRDSEEDVRNNAVRALWVLAKSSRATAARIPAEPFIEMLNSGMWADRNKAGLLLETLSVSRDQCLLARLRSSALESLLEMARWRDAGHAYAARILLGRVAGIEEARLQQLVQNSQTDEIISAVRATQ